MRLSRGLRPVWGLAALALAVSLFCAPGLARAGNDDDDEDSGQGTVKIYSNDNSRDDDAKPSQAKGYLGVQVQDVTRSLQRARNLPTEEGALINSVEPDSPADRTGIRRGDVIVEVDGQKVSDSEDLIRVVRALEPGNKVRITLWRSGSLRTISTQLAERPNTPPKVMGLPGSDDDQMTWTMHGPMPGMSGNPAEMERQIKDLQDQVRQLQEELRALRNELRSNDNDRDNDRGNDSGNDNGSDD